MTTDEALTEQIARTIRLADTGDSLPAGFAARMWDDGVTNRGKEMHLAAAVLPIIRKAQADAWDEGHRDTLAYIASGNLNGDEHHAEPTNRYRTEETTP